ncbi:MAG: CHAP domain-containing protein [Eubacteriales bacterium]|nr:CHAP domain-containing protein [Eubacteriales bacterium]
MKKWFLLLIALLSVSFAQAENISLTKDTPAEIANLITVAREELGTIEEKDGTSKYGIWAGDPQAEWCAEFLCWAVNQTDERFASHLLKNVYPLYSGQNTGRDWFLSQGRYIHRTGRVPNWGTQWYWETGQKLETNSYVPKTGDFMFLGYEGNFNTSHVALVEYVEQTNGETIVHVIEGNNPDRVQRNSYPLGKGQILGYGTYANTNIGTTMRFGNRGFAVENMQKHLAALDYISEYDITAHFDQASFKAICKYQQDHGWLANGVADFKVQKSLKEQFDRMIYYNPDQWIVEE